jgi:hypothetical protein
MKKLVTGAIIGGVIGVPGLFGWQRGHHPLPPVTATPDDTGVIPTVERDDSRFHCDGRVYCSQMTAIARG